MACERPPRERSERGGRSHTISNWSWATRPCGRGYSFPPLRGFADAVAKFFLLTLADPQRANALVEVRAFDPQHARRAGHIPIRLLECL